MVPFVNDYNQPFDVSATNSINIDESGANEGG